MALIRRSELEAISAVTLVRQRLTLIKDACWPRRSIGLVKQLRITWQRLVDAEGKTCDRCDATHNEMRRAFDKLKQALRPLGIEPTLEIREIDRKTFEAGPAESNRIWIAGRPMEEWLGATVGSSPCCSVCGEAQCRTVQVGPTTYEAIPQELFIKAGLMAASQLLEPEPVT